ncbi:MAG: nucleoside-diphosphate sugar epimerase [Crocinitomicaceae bacterium]|nr:nucleoside-diphosphate sugar epimerase [Crocinitomicaceae bacterium]|tara:strand:- start:15339 stop:16538 length:1200 start_codon:yes stop_codon:yes gene_type:complete
MELNKFISENITGRSKSMFEFDINQNKLLLGDRIHDKSVLVIGGAGTIGSSFIRALLHFKPKSLVIVDINENGLTELTRDLRSTNNLFIPNDYVTYPMSYAGSVFNKMFKSRKGFDIVANFSAHKHVRSEKDIFSVEALINNNVINAKKLLDTLELYPPKHFFCVSTDKAANPVNIMGGSKKIMEEIIMTYSQKFPVTTARFANVAFSNGSLPQGFLERISKKQPISAPKDVKRYFVSPEESGQICLLACILGNTGEIYFPKLRENQVMTFSNIAIKLIKAQGYDLDYCSSEKEALKKTLNGFDNKYPVYFSASNTTGEKQYEEFYTKEETVSLNKYQALGVVVNLKSRKILEVNELLNNLNNAFDNEMTSKKDIVTIIKNFLKNFNHQELGKSLDSKM